MSRQPSSKPHVVGCFSKSINVFVGKVRFSIVDDSFFLKSREFIFYYFIFFVGWDFNNKISFNDILSNIADNTFDKETHLDERYKNSK